MKTTHSYWFPWILVLYEITLYLSNDMYLPALPAMMQDLNLTESEVQFTITLWFIGSACLPMIMGGLSDRFGRRPTLLIGGVIYVLTTIACALSTGQLTLLPARFFQGAIITSMMVAGYAVIHESYEQKAAIQILAMMGSVSVLAPALGPLAGACLLLLGNWRWIFWFIAMSASATLIYLYFRMPETLKPEHQHPFHFPTLLRTYANVFTNKKFLSQMLIFGLTFMGFMGWLTAGSLLMIDHYHRSPIEYGLIQFSVFFAYIFGSYCTKWLVNHLSAEQLIVIGLGITLVGGVLIYPISYLIPHQVYYFTAAMIIYSFGSGLSFAPLNRLIIESSEEPMGIRVGAFNIGLTLSGSIGSLLASLMYNGKPTSVSLLILLSIALPVCFLLIARLKTR